MLTDIPAPWKGFLEKLDTLLEEPVRLDCIGGFAVVMATVSRVPQTTWIIGRSILTI
jgi:hypothetical protein